MLEALFAIAAEAVFSYILDTLEPAERLRDWLKRQHQKLPRLQQRLNWTQLSPGIESFHRVIGRCASAAAGSFRMPLAER